MGVSISHVARRGAIRVLGAIAVVCALGCATTQPVEDGADVKLHKARIHYDVAVQHLASGRSALAIRELQQAAELDPSDPWITLALAEAYRRKGRVEEAETYLLRCLEIKPGWQHARLNLSALYIQLDHHQEALVHAKALVDDPTFPAPWRALTNLGWAEFKLGRRQPAREHLEQALEYHDGYWPALLDLGILEATEGNRLQALALFERVLALEPGPFAEAETHFRMGEIYVSLGQRERAIRHLTAVGEQRPSGTWGKRSADYLKLLR
jgi:tetratricopeptide (TPR) repeat protein